MSFRVHVRSVAQAELDEIHDHYEKVKPGLGGRFTDAFDACLEVLEVNPFFQKRKGDYRYLMLHKFRTAWCSPLRGTG